MAVIAMRSVAMRATDSEQLATKLGRPPASMSGLRGLTGDQVGALSDAIDDAAAAHHRAVEDAFLTVLPLLPRRLLVRLLRFANDRPASLS
jgi:hypothetical protein